MDSLIPQNANTWLSLRGDLIQADNIHPNAKGHLFIATALKRFIYSGNDKVTYSKTITNANGTLILTVSNGKLHMVGSGNVSGIGPTVAGVFTLPNRLTLPFNQIFPIWRDSQYASFFHFVNEKIDIITPQQSTTIGAWRFNQTIMFPLYIPI